MSAPPSKDIADSGAPSARSSLPPAVLLLGFTSFFTDVGSEMVFPLLPAFVASLGAGPTFLGLVEGVADATASVLKLLSGRVADRLPRRKGLVLAGYGIASAVRPLVALASAPWHVLAVRVTDRLGKGIRSAPRDLLIAEAVEPHLRGRAFGLHRAMDHAGAVVGPLVASALLALGWPVRDVFLAAAVPGVLSVLAVARVRETTSSAPAPAPIAANDDAAPAATPTAASLPGPLRVYLGILLLFCLGNSSDIFLLLRAQELGVPLASLPLLWTVFHLAKVVASILGGAWADRLPRRTLIASGWLVYALTYVGFAAASQPWQAWLLFVGYGAYFGLTEPAEKALVGDLASPQIRGRAFGAYHFIVGAAAIPAGLLTGWLWEHHGAATALHTGAAIALTAALAQAATRRGDAPLRPHGAR